LCERLRFVALTHERPLTRPFVRLSTVNVVVAATVSL